jgi:hypothetical protein
MLTRSTESSLPVSHLVCGSRPDTLRMFDGSFRSAVTRFGLAGRAVLQW